MLFADFFLSLSGPISSIFISAFVWRTTGSFFNAVANAAGGYIALPVGFYLNGLILKRISVRTAYTVGSLLTGLSVACASFFGYGGPAAWFLYGCLWGIANALYWANRNYLELQETVDSHRKRYFSIVMTVGYMCNVVIPPLAGWILVLCPRLGGSTQVAYWAVFGLSFFFMTAGALVIASGGYKTVRPTRLCPPYQGRVTARRRLLTICQGLTDGINFLSPLIVLYLFKNEGILGTVTACVTLFAALAMYAYGHLTHHSHTRGLLVTACAGFLVCAAFLAFQMPPFGAGVYIVFAAVCSDFYMLSVAPWMLRLSEEEIGGNEKLRYAFICDNELFLNIGRLCSVFLIGGIMCVSTEHAGLFYGPVFVSLLQVTLSGIFLSRFGAA
jgi:MFS family permease